MQIKMKPGKPTEPGDYVCILKGSSRPEYARIGSDKDELCLVVGVFEFTLEHLEEDTLFSERIDLVVDNQ